MTKTNNRGGARKGAGRKPSTNPKKQLAIRIDPTIYAFLNESRATKTMLIEKAIKQLPSFQEWNALR